MHAGEARRAEWGFVPFDQGGNMPKANLGCWLSFKKRFNLRCCLTN